MSNERPDGWHEPVHEALLRPASFYGAAPRTAVLLAHGVCVLVLLIAGMTKSWLLAGVAVGTASLVQIGTASLTYLEPQWFDSLRQWLVSPQSKVDP